MAEPIISVSGLRGVVGDTLTPEVAIRYAAAFAAALPPGDILIGRDSRPSGRMLSLAVQAGLQAAGTHHDRRRHRRHAHRRRSAATLQGRRRHSDHRQPQSRAVQRAEAVLRRRPRDSRRAGPRGLGTLSHRHARLAAAGPPRRLSSDATTRVTAHLLAVLDTVDAERIRKRRFRVLLDWNHGAGSILGRRLLHELACRVTVLGEEPDGQFAHPAEPTAENLAGVLTAVTDAGADVGFCQDPDADRLAVIDAVGPLPGRGIHAGDVRRSRAAAAEGRRLPIALSRDCCATAIAANCSSRMSEDLAERYGVPYFRSAVGEANVVDAMLAHGAVFGGEGNGGPIDPRVGYVRDSFVGMALLLDAMAARQMTIGQLADELPRYEIVKTKISLAAGKAAGRVRCAGEAIFRRGRRSARRPAARLARPLALGPRQQHRADRPRDRRSPDGRRSVVAMRSGGSGNTIGQEFLICGRKKAAVSHFAAWVFRRVDEFPPCALRCRLDGAQLLPSARKPPHFSFAACISPQSSPLQSARSDDRSRGPIGNYGGSA